MRNDDRDDALVRRLCAADAEAPPPPGAAITPERLVAHGARRLRRHAAIATVALLGALPLLLALPPAFDAAGRDGDRLRTDLGVLESRFDDLLRTLQSPPVTTDPFSATDRPDHRLRLQLAFARASAVPVRATNPTETR